MRNIVYSSNANVLAIFIAYGLVSSNYEGFLLLFGIRKRVLVKSVTQTLRPVLIIRHEIVSNKERVTSSGRGSG